MKKKIIGISILLILCIGIIGVYFIFNNRDNSTNIVVSNKKSGSDITDIDWSSYGNYDVDISTGDVTISKSGVYNISGSNKNASIVVDTEDNVKIVLDNVSITFSLFIFISFPLSISCFNTVSISLSLNSYSTV